MLILWHNYHSLGFFFSLSHALCIIFFTFICIKLRNRVVEMKTAATQFSRSCSKKWITIHDLEEGKTCQHSKLHYSIDVANLLVVAQTLPHFWRDLKLFLCTKKSRCTQLNFTMANVNVDFPSKWIEWKWMITHRDLWHFKIGLPDGINFGTFRKFNCIFNVTNGIFQFDFPFQSSQFCMHPCVCIYEHLPHILPHIYVF